MVLSALHKLVAAASLITTAAAAGEAAAVAAGSNVGAAAKKASGKLNIQDNVIEVNKTRYKLANLTMEEITPDLPGNLGPIQKLLNGNKDFTPGTYKVEADTDYYPPKASLLHPNFWTYWVHVLVQVIMAIMAIKCPCALLAVILLSVMCWPISAIFNHRMWGMIPFKPDWWLMAAKSLIVQWAPSTPMMLCLIYKPKQSVRQCAAIWTYIVLWLNVAWTLCFLPMAFKTVAIVNGFCAISLLVSLTIHLVAQCRHKVTLFEVEDDIVYGFGTSLSWLVCYTAWNALFVIESAVGLCLQDIFFWAMMIFFWYHSECRSPLENYFAMARPISLSGYIASSDWPGLLDYFRNATPLGVDLTRHAYFLFLATANFVFSFYVLYWAICLCCNWGGSREYYQQFEGWKRQEDEDDEEEGYSEDE
jgi:hypothetical protein